MQVSSLQLFRLVSPAFPVGAYAYSRGLEHAVEVSWVADEDTARSWILGVLVHAVAPLDGAVLVRLHDAFAACDVREVERWNLFLEASRDSSELLMEDRQMGAALARLLADLDVDHHDIASDGLGYTAMFARAAACWGIGRRDALGGYLWGFVESQVSAAMRLIPLGQTSGQRIISSAVETLVEQVNVAVAIGDEDIGGFAAGMAVASAHHEDQYSRLFRS